MTAEASRRWRAENPDRVREYNQQRRQAYRQAHPLLERQCVECGQPFTAAATGSRQPGPASAVPRRERRPARWLASLGAVFWPETLLRR